MTLVSLAGLNDALSSGDHDIKRKTLYGMLNEYAVFQDIKKVKTTIIDIGEEDEEEGQDEESKQDLKDSEIVS